MSDFTPKDVVRIMEAIQVDTSKLLAQPFPVKNVKDYAMTVWFPAVNRVFYPNGMTFGDAMKEAFLYDYFQELWSSWTINIILDIIGEVFDLDDDDWKWIRDKLIRLLSDLLKKLFE